MIDPVRLAELLPWRAPFLMIDGCVECAPGARITTRRAVSAGDPVLAAGGSAAGEDGFFPATLLLEGLSQSAALLYRLTYEDAGSRSLPMLGFLAATIHGSARAGDEIRFVVEATKMTRLGGVFRGTAFGAGASPLAEAELAFAAGREETLT
jgi:3-hydroxymyristoyl/3-hydroxydecanoyl-(acyl carrier protein) dehydratase